MGVCKTCGSTYDDDAAFCPFCNAPVPPKQDAPAVPIWTTLAPLPEGEDLPDDYLEAADNNTAADASDESANAPAARVFPILSDDDRDRDIFDETKDGLSFLFSNMSPKAKRIFISVLISLLLSLIPLIYYSCSHRNPSQDTGSPAAVLDSAYSSAVQNNQSGGTGPK